MPDNVLQIDDRGPVRVLRMNRPEKLNALNTVLLRELHAALLAANDDESVRALVLAGAGRAFCAGADLAEHAETTASARPLSYRGHVATQIMILLRQLSKPILSVVQGAAVGAGAALAIGCDMMIAGGDLKLGYPEIRHTMIPGIVMPSLQRQIGQKLAFEMISTGRLLNADEAAAIGLANRVVEPARALDTGVEIATGWAGSDPVALSAIKTLFYRVADLPFDEAARTGHDAGRILRAFRAATA
jgi:enoyl-CoA hydratase